MKNSWHLLLFNHIITENTTPVCHIYIVFTIYKVHPTEKFLHYITAGGCACTHLPAMVSGNTADKTMLAFSITIMALVRLP